MWQLGFRLPRVCVPTAAGCAAESLWGAHPATSLSAPLRVPAGLDARAQALQLIKRQACALIKPFTLQPCKPFTLRCRLPTQ